MIARPKVVLDTDILSELLKQRDLMVLETARTYVQAHGLLTFTTISFVEIFAGLHARDARSQMPQAGAFFSANEEIVPDHDDYELAAEMIGLLRRAGQPIGWNDPIIAACAYRRGFRLATGNTKHYERLARIGFSLELENWRH